MRFPRFLKKILRTVAYLVIILFISIGIFEVLLRFGLYEPQTRMYEYTILFDKDVLFRIAPNCRPDINEMGYRGADFDREKSDFKKRVLFLGDSFVMGDNVAPEKTIPAALERALDGVEVFNMGVLAYGPDQSLVQLLEDGIDQQQFERLKDSKEGFFGPENTTSRLCEELNIPYLNLYPEFLGFEEGERALLYESGDWHLSPFGNQIAGDLAASVLVGPLLSESSGRPRTGQRSWH